MGKKAQTQSFGLLITIIVVSILVFLIILNWKTLSEMAGSIARTIFGA